MINPTSLRKHQLGLPLTVVEHFAFAWLSTKYKCTLVYHFRAEGLAVKKFSNEDQSTWVRFPF